MNEILDTARSNIGVIRAPNVPECLLTRGRFQSCETVLDAKLLCKTTPLWRCSNSEYTTLGQGSKIWAAHAADHVPPIRNKASTTTGQGIPWALHHPSHPFSTDALTRRGNKVTLGDTIHRQQLSIASRFRRFGNPKGLRYVTSVRGAFSTQRS